MVRDNPKVLDLMDKAIREAKKGKKKVTTNSSRNTIQGTTKAYTVSRLEREAGGREIHEQAKRCQLATFFQ
jgi:hypothetical protein